MSKIVVFGDSWGDPEVADNVQRSGFTNQGHVVNLLKTAGHAVTNFSKGGVSNLVSWLYLRDDPRDFSDTDWIIWFHTEMARDWKPQKGWHLCDRISEWSNHVYARIAELQRQRLGAAGLILIEGQSTRVEPEFSCYFQPLHMVKDWRSELCAEPLPDSQIMAPLLSNPRLLRGCKDPQARQNRWLNNIHKLISAMKLSPYFSDDCHPNDLAHRELFTKLQTWICPGANDETRSRTDP